MHIYQLCVFSENTTKEVVTALLKKYKILDNPRKFAMYAQELENGKIGEKSDPGSMIWLIWIRHTHT